MKQSSRRIVAALLWMCLQGTVHAQAPAVTTAPSVGQSPTHAQGATKTTPASDVNRTRQTVPGTSPHTAHQKAASAVPDPNDANNAATNGQQ
jgi:hypothetical protein